MTVPTCCGPFGSSPPCPPGFAAGGWPLDSSFLLPLLLQKASELQVDKCYKMHIRSGWNHFLSTPSSDLRWVQVFTEIQSLPLQLCSSSQSPDCPLTAGSSPSFCPELPVSCSLLWGVLLPGVFLKHPFKMSVPAWHALSLFPACVWTREKVQSHVPPGCARLPPPGLWPHQPHPLASQVASGIHLKNSIRMRSGVTSDSPSHKKLLSWVLPWISFTIKCLLSCTVSSLRNVN